MIKKKILIIEDEPSLSAPLIEKFQQEDNFEVAIAVNGQGGLESALKNHPDLILFDVIMPVMDGITKVFYKNNIIINLD